MRLKDLYKTYKEDKKPLLMSEKLLTKYPQINNNTSNFVSDYLADFENFDLMMCLKYGDADLLYTEQSDNWLDLCDAVMVNSIFSLARMYYALSIAYDPTHNYDGKSEIITRGTLSKDGGSDVDTYIHGEKKTTDRYGETNTETVNSTIPYDMTNTYKNTDKATVNGKPFENSTTEQTYTDTNNTEYGKETTVDYTVTEIKGGNLGVTMTTQMLESEWDFRKKDFFNMVYDKIYANLLTWGYGG